MKTMEENFCEQRDKENMQKQKSTEIVIVDSGVIRDKIYVVRGVQVMLDFELAEIYGYTTSAFNQQVKRNEEKFPDDFRFQLTTGELLMQCRLMDLMRVHQHQIFGVLLCRRQGTDAERKSKRNG